MNIQYYLIRFPADSDCVPLSPSNKSTLRVFWDTCVLIGEVYYKFPHFIALQGVLSIGRKLGVSVFGLPKREYLDGQRHFVSSLSFASKNASQKTTYTTVGDPLEAKRCGRGKRMGRTGLRLRGER